MAGTDLPAFAEKTKRERSFLVILKEFLFSRHSGLDPESGFRFWLSSFWVRQLTDEESRFEDGILRSPEAPSGWRKRGGGAGYLSASGGKLATPENGVTQFTAR